MGAYPKKLWIKIVPVTSSGTVSQGVQPSVIAVFRAPHRARELLLGAHPTVWEEHLKIKISNCQKDVKQSNCSKIIKSNPCQARELLMGLQGIGTRSRM